MCKLLELYVVLFEVRNLFAGWWGYVYMVAFTFYSFFSRGHPVVFKYNNKSK